MTKQEKIDLYRQRFAGRTDLFGKKWISKDGKRSGYMPVCSNQWTDKCLIQKQEGRCAECPHKEHSPLTDEWIWKHISGKEQLIIYLLNNENKVKFAAIDIDFKAPPIPEPKPLVSEEMTPEERQTFLDRVHSEWEATIKRLTPTFKDVQLLYKASQGYGIPVHVARSTAKGYHLYFFFDKPVDAKFATSYIIHLYDICGFYQDAQEGKLLPEIFPKQVIFQNDKQIGNGIKPPLIEPQMDKGRNCFVNVNDEPYGDQWAYTSSASEINVDSFLSFLTQKKIRIHETASGNSIKYVNGQRADHDKVPYIQPLRGDFKKVIRLCPAAKAAWESKAPSHDQRVWLLSLAIHTRNGKEILDKIWDNPIAKNQINFAIASNQQSWTCKAAQQHQCCVIGNHPKSYDHCLKKRPPVEVVAGQSMINPHNIPETEWPEPSPIRFAFQQETDAEIKQIIFNEIDALAKDPPKNLNEALYELLKQCTDFEEINKKDVELYIKRTLGKLVNTRDIKSISNQVDKERAKEIGAPTNIREVNGKRFTIENGCYCAVTSDIKGNPKLTPFTNFIIKHEKDVIVRKNEAIEDIIERVSIGKILIGKRGYRFEINQNVWASQTELLRALHKCTGFKAVVDRQNLDNLNSCIYLFNDPKEEIQVKEFGWSKDTYLTPSIIVDKDGVHLNDRLIVKLDAEGVTAGLNFKKLSTSELKETLLVIKNYFLTYADKKMTYTALAHTLGAAVRCLFPFDKSPILWLTGDTGTGKSYMLDMMQHFYGSFRSILNTSTTTKSIEQYGSVFKDALFGVDDFKLSTVDNPKAFMQIMQNAYDKSMRGLLNKDSTQREARRINGLLGVTGEDFVGHDSAAISRTVIINVTEKTDTANGMIAFEKRKDYCGVTPEFIHFMLQESKEEIAGRFQHISQSIKKEIQGINEDRIANNLAFNYVVFEYFFKFLARRDIAHLQEVEDTCKFHYNQILEIGRYLSERCVDDTAGEQYLEALSTVLMSAEYGIKGFPGHNNRRSTIGYYIPEKDKEVVFISPSASMSAIRKHVQPLLVSQDHIQRQLFGKDILKLSTRRNNQVHWIQSDTKVRCWAIKLTALDMHAEGDQVKDIDGRLF